MTEIHDTGIAVIIPADALARTRIYKDLVTSGQLREAEIDSTAQTILTRLAETEGRYFTSLSTPGNNISSLTCNFGYKLQTVKGRVEAQVSVHDDLSVMLHHDVVDGSDKSTLEQTLKGLPGIIIRDGTYHLGDDQTRAFRMGRQSLGKDDRAGAAIITAYLNALFTYQPIDHNWVKDPAKMGGPMHYGQQDHTYVDIHDPSVERVTAMDHHIGEFLDWLITNRPAIDSVGEVLRAAHNTYSEATYVERKVQKGELQPRIVSELKVNAARYVQTALEMQLKLTVPTNNRMEYVPSTIS
jgi:hypothetical protein